MKSTDTKTKSNLILVLVSKGIKVPRTIKNVITILKKNLIKMTKLKEKNTAILLSNRVEMTENRISEIEGQTVDLFNMNKS